MKNENKTTIWIDKNVKEELEQLGAMGDTYADVIKMLIGFYKESKGIKTIKDTTKTIKKNNEIDKTGWKTTFDKDGYVVDRKD